MKQITISAQGKQGHSAKEKGCEDEFDGQVLKSFYKLEI